MAAPIKVSSGARVTKNGGGASTLTPSITCTPGNRLVATFEFNVYNGSTAIATPTGWTLIHSLSPSGAQTYKPQIASFEKVAASTTENCPITTVGTDTYGYGQITEWSGVTAVDTAASTTANNGNSTATSSSVTAASTLAVADSVAIVHGTAETGGGGTSTYSTPATINGSTTGVTSIGNNPNDSTIIAYDASYKTLSSTTAPTAGYTWSGGSRYQIGLIILSGSAGGGSDVTVTPGVGSASFAGFAPTAVSTHNITVTPGVGSGSFAGFAPSAVPSNNITVVSGTGQATFAGLAPTAIAQDNKVALPGTGQGTFVGFAPSAVSSQNQIVQPGTGQAAFAGQAPTPVSSDNKVATPGTGVATFAGQAPTPLSGNQQVVQPGTGQAVFSGFAPIASPTQNQFARPGTGQAVFDGFAPQALNGQNQKVPIVGSGLPFFDVVEQ